MSEHVEWIDLGKTMPWLRGQRIHVVPTSLEERTREGLIALGFSVYVLRGERIHDGDSFFDEAVASLSLPGYFGRNWDALNDSLGDLELPDDFWPAELKDGEFPEFARRIAILWHNAQEVVHNDLQVLLSAVSVVEQASLGGARSPHLQLELVLFGPTPSFKGFATSQA